MVGISRLTSSEYQKKRDQPHNVGEKVRRPRHGEVVRLRVYDAEEDAVYRYAPSVREGDLYAPRCPNVVDRAKQRGREDDRSGRVYEPAQSLMKKGAEDHLLDQREDEGRR